MKKIAVILLVIIILPGLTGCWDRREPENLAIVLLGAYDYNPQTQMYKIILQIESMQAVQQGGQDGGGGGDKPPFWVVSAWGYTPIDAVSNISKKVSRRIDYSHMHLLVISETMAREEGIVTVMDTLARSRQSRPIVNIAVTGDDVEKVLSSEIPIETTAGQGLLNLIQITEKESGTAIIQNGRQFLNRLSTPGIEPVATHLELLETGGNQKEPDAPSPLKMSGLAAFRQDRFTGILKDGEARGWNWLYGEKKVGIINFTYPENKEVKVTVSARCSSGDIIPELKDEKPLIKINLEVRGRIQSLTGLNYFKEQSDIIRSMKARLAEAVRNDIRSAIEKSRQLDSDIFGLENAFYRLKYDQWERRKDEWDEIFRQLQVEINVKATLEKSGLVNRGLKLR